MWVYIQSGSNPGLWTVGFYKPDGSWNATKDFEWERDAQALVSRLNGKGESS